MRNGRTRVRSGMVDMHMAIDRQALSREAAKNVFADANARIRRSHPGVAGGDVDPPGSSGVDGEIILQFAQDAGLVIVNNFNQAHQQRGCGTRHFTTLTVGPPGQMRPHHG